MTSPTKKVAAPTEQKRKNGHAELPVAVAMTTPPRNVDHDVPAERCSSHSDAGSTTFVWPGTEQRSNVAISTAEQVVPASTDDRHKFDGEGGPPTGANPGTEGNRGTESNCDRRCQGAADSSP